MKNKHQKPNPYGQVVSVRLEPQIINRLNRLTQRTGRSRGFYLRTAIALALDYLERIHWEHEALQYEQDRFEADFQRITEALMREFPGYQDKPEDDTQDPTIF